MYIQNIPYGEQFPLLSPSSALQMLLEYHQEGEIPMQPTYNTSVQMLSSLYLDLSPLEFRYLQLACAKRKEKKPKKTGFFDYTSKSIGYCIHCCPFMVWMSVFYTNHIRAHNGFTEQGEQPQISIFIFVGQKTINYRNDNTIRINLYTTELVK